MALAPAVGAVLGLVAALVLWVASWGYGAGLAALLAVAVLAVLTRVIHWDGLADLADGLGSARPAPDALEIMRRGDIGPFGVLAVVVVVGVQVGTLATLPPAAVVVATVLGRWAMALACRRGVPAARAGGLGATVAGTLSAPLLLAALAVTALLLGAVAAATTLTVLRLGVALALVSVWSLAATGYVVRRLGGITGDVLGALAETSTAVALLALALR
jgi:adenosylcobinamide-GDP ribazoletransferase